MKTWVFLLFLFSTVFAGLPCDVLVYVQDAGETNGLIPFIERLQKEGRSYQVMGGGVSKKILGERGIPFTPIDAPLNRKERVDDAGLAAIAELFSPSIFVSGVAFELEGQLYAEFGKRGVRTFAFWDNFNSGGSDPYFETARKVVSRASVAFVPSDSVRAAVGKDARVVGQPTLEEWIEKARQVDVAQLRRQLGWNRRTILWIGGYGAEYEEAFSLFLDSVKGVDGWDVAIQPHPKFGGEIERKILEARGEKRSLLTGVGTIDAVAAADRVVCYRSTVGFQALFIHKPVIYANPRNESYDPPLAAVFATPDEFLEKVNDRIRIESDPFASLGIPQHAVEAIWSNIFEE